MRLTKFVPVLLIAAQVGLVNQSIAQAPPAQPQAAAGGRTPMYRPGARRGAPQESMHRTLQALPGNIPVPIPPDAKFVTGYQSQYHTTKQMTYVRMNTENSPAALVEWYRKNLQSYAWNYKEKPAEKAGMLPSFSGSKGPVLCSINFEGPIGRLGKTTAIMISFNEGR